MIKKSNLKLITKIIPKILWIFLVFLTTSLLFFSAFFPLQIEKADSEKDLPELRISFITDLHIKSDSINRVKSNRKIKRRFVEILENFQQETTENFLSDAVVVNGDVIEGTNRGYVVGSAELKQTKKYFDKFNLPIFWAIGNHDLRSVNKQQWKESLDIDYLFHSFELKGYRIIILDSNFDSSAKEDIRPGKYFTRGKLSDLQLKWLEVELAKNSKKALVFIHHPPLTKEDVPSRSNLLAKASRFQKIISKSGNVLAVFSGHIEELHHKIKNGIHYFVIPGTTKSPDYLGNFVEIKVKDNNLKVEMKYFDKDKTYTNTKIILK